MISMGCKPKNLEKTLEKEPDVIFPQNEIQILFLKNEEEMYVEACEANSLPCSEILEHLNNGESIFISRKIVSQETHKIRTPFDKAKDILYFDRI